MTLDYGSKSIEWWKDFYIKKSKDEYDKPDNIFELYNSKKGFAQFSTSYSKNILIIYHVCGDANYWQNLAKRIARMAGKDCLATILKRNPIAYCRGRGWRIDSIKYHGDEKYIELKATNQEGFLVTINQQGYVEDGRPLYFVVEKIK